MKCRNFKCSVMTLECFLATACFVIFVRPTILAADKPKSKQSVFADDNLVAWCIVPFDAAKRGPDQRAAMLKRLGIRRVAYDWRDEHVSTFEEEILAYKKNDLEYTAFWSVHEEAFRLFEKHDIHPQIWAMMPSPGEGNQDSQVKSAARAMLPLVKRTKKMKCELGLYNHGGWAGEPKNMVDVCRWLRDNERANHVGIVYNLHHGHDHIQDFSQQLKLMRPYLICLNLNGMNDDAKPKILPIGKGQHDRAMLRTILTSGYKGPIGILDHRGELDAEESLQQNLRGLRKLRTELE